MVTLLLVAGVVVVVAGVHGRSADSAARNTTGAGSGEGGRRSNNGLPDGVETVRDLPLLADGAAVPALGCELPEFSTEPRRLSEYYLAELDCLEKAWAPALAEVGIPFLKVNLRLDDEPETACGALPPSDEATGLYCHTDSTIYLPRARILDSLGEVEQAHLATVAHEYGHHVQRMAGVLDVVNAELADYEEAGPEDRALNRKVELQANCFAGMFLAAAGGNGSVSTATAEAAVADFENWVDSETHGSSATQLHWAEAGYAARDTSACDTWNGDLGSTD
ncbi:hypothetical protein BAY61_07360 [Prauserella marina]|nr:hypothetical protein BAY61_07360 [Prauserella marina]